MAADLARDKILKTTLKIIGNEGAGRLTIRRIARESEVNVASINYYFRSKENLISEALQLYGLGMKNSFSILSEPSMPPKEKLTIFLETFSNQLIKYPGFMTSQITRIIEGMDMTPEAVANMSFGKQKIIELLTDVIDGKSEKELSMLLFQMMAGIIIPLFFGKYVKEIYGFDFTDDEDRKEFISLSVKNLIGLGE